MDFGYFTMPSHPPERSLRDGFAWDLQTARWCDELGYTEAWFGEHHTCAWEPNPAPDLLIAQALLQTKNIRLGPGGFCLPYHHPAELANRISMLDHISGGRLNVGMAASAIPTDFEMFDVDGRSGVNREMTRESLEIMLRLWSDEGPFEYKGKYWTVRKPEPIPEQTLGAHLKPLQRPHPPIGVAGVSKNSDTLKLAGERGFMPMSINLNPSFVASHWESVEEGAARVGRTAKRADWRLVREVLVADTDKEAMRWAAEGPMGRMMGEYYIPFLKRAGILDFVKHDPSVADSDVTPAYCAKHNWVIGSVDTVAEKLEAIHHEVGGFGTLLVYGFDYADTPEVWHNSLQVIAREISPRLSHLQADAPERAAA